MERIQIVNDVVKNVQLNGQEDGRLFYFSIKLDYILLIFLIYRPFQLKKSM